MSAKFRRPRIDPLVLSGLTDTGTQTLSPDEAYEGQRFSDAHFSDKRLSDCVFIECELDRWAADELDLRGARIAESRISQMSVPVLVARRSVWRDVEISGSRIGAAEIYDAGLNQVTVAHCKLGWWNLRASILNDVLFSHCTFDELDLGSAKMNRVAFDDCVANKVTLANAQARDVDLRGLDMQRIEGVDGLGGTIVTSAQALRMVDAFAERFGFTIQD